MLRVASCAWSICPANASSKVAKMNILTYLSIAYDSLMASANNGMAVDSHEVVTAAADDYSVVYESFVVGPRRGKRAGESE